MAYSNYWGNMVFHRLDRITNMQIADKKATPLRSIPGFENGINYKELSSAMPYMYTDTPEHIEFLADIGIVDQIMDWFGADVKLTEAAENGRVQVSLKASPSAMMHWAMQYIGYIEVTAPASLREKIRTALEKGLEKYNT